MRKNHSRFIKIIKKSHVRISEAMTIALDIVLRSLQKCFLAHGLTLEGWKLITFVYFLRS